MSKEKITFINRTPKTSKAGKPYTSLSLKVESKGDRYINGFANKANDHWTIGQEVDLIIEEKGQYLNFTMAESKKGEELANNMKIDSVYSMQLDTNAMLRNICQHLGLPHGFEGIQKAREEHNAKLPVRDGYTSKGADGEAPIKASDVDFVAREDDVDISEIPF